MLLIYCLHGDELASEEIAKQLNKEFGIKILIGNPKARKRKIRFIESDLNRSFKKSGTYESNRAEELRQFLLKSNEDLIIDLHITTAKMIPVGIMTDPKQLNFAARLGLSDVVLMNKRFSKGGSLIENIPNSISLEIYPDKNSIKQAKRFILNGLTPEQKTDNFNIYEVVNIVKKEDAERNAENMRKLKNGYYPIFYGEKAYKKVAYLETRKSTVTIGRC